MHPSKTVFVRGVMQAPSPIALLGTGVLLTLLACSFRMTLPETIGVQAELDSRRCRNWRKNGRYHYRYAPRFTASAVAFGTDYFDVRYFDTTEGGHLVTF